METNSKKKKIFYLLAFECFKNNLNTLMSGHRVQKFLYLLTIIFMNLFKFFSIEILISRNINILRHHYLKILFTKAMLKNFPLDFFSSSILKSML